MVLKNLFVVDEKWKWNGQVDVKWSFYCQGSEGQCLAVVIVESDNR